MSTRMRFDRLEVALIALAAAVAAFVLASKYHENRFLWLSIYARYPLEEREKLQLAYGPQKHSLGIEEWIVRDHFQDRRQGVFLDVGASHYRHGSNTYYLEQTLGWSGIAIDARPEFGPEYKQHRPRTRFVAIFASDVNDSSVQFFVPAKDPFVASADQTVAKEAGEPVSARTVPTATLNTVLEHAGVRKIDFLNMDIELAEPKALAGFDVELYRPELVCIEAHAPTRQYILDYFSAHSYQLVSKYLRVDTSNLYFQPAH